MFGKRATPEPQEATSVLNTMVEGARLTVQMQQRELVRAGEALSRAAYVLRDKAECGYEAGQAMQASQAAFEAAGVEQ